MSTQLLTQARPWRIDPNAELALLVAAFGLGMTWMLAWAGLDPATTSAALAP